MLYTIKSIQKEDLEKRDIEVPIRRFSTLDLLGCNPEGDANSGPTLRRRCVLGVTATSCSLTLPKLNVSKTCGLISINCDFKLLKSLMTSPLRFCENCCKGCGIETVIGATYQFDNYGTFHGHESCMQCY
jgi:hypothetical protein